MIAIKSVAIISRQMTAKIDADMCSEAAEIEQLLVQYDLATTELKYAYERLEKDFSGLPTYTELTSDVEAR